MSTTLLSGLKVLDMAGEPLAMTGRMLRDLGAEVVKLEPPGGDPLRRAAPVHPASGLSLRFMAWNAGKTRFEFETSDDRVYALLAAADVVIETPGFLGATDFAQSSAPLAVWLKATPFGRDGPRANWRASDLGILAASGNLYATGCPDRAPVRCSEPVAYAHASAEAVFAILTALASGRPQLIDLSMQETVMTANMGGAGQLAKTGHKGRRQGAAMGRTREIWACRDGFVSFGLRAGRARLHNFDILREQMQGENLLTPAWSERDWVAFDPAALDDIELQAIEQPLASYFLKHTMAELYALAVATNLMLAPANSASDILESAQLRARNLFATTGDIAHSPSRFVVVRGAQESVTPATAPLVAPALSAGPWPAWPAQPSAAAGSIDPACQPRTPAWQGLKLLEFGSGAAGPIASRYFAEHGATVIRVESRQHPDFLRSMASDSPHGLEGSNLFDALNVGKQSIALNLRHPRGREIARQLVFWADAVLENFPPRVMSSHGLAYEQLVGDTPDLLMLSSCLNGQSGPHKDYPGFGGQGAALAGFNFLTGWPDREPIGPYGTITDSLSPRFAASALAAGLLYRRRTGRGLHLDMSQVETGVYSLSPWLLEYAHTGHCAGRQGNRSVRAAPHGVFPCLGEDRWIAIACWDDHDWLMLATVLGLDSRRYPDLPTRLAAPDEIEALITQRTLRRNAETLAGQLQYAGVEAVPVADFEDLFARDPQLKERDHFVRLERPLTGASVYERNGFRLTAADSGYTQPAPLLGQHTDDILRTLLCYTPAEVEEIRTSGALE